MEPYIYGKVYGILSGDSLIIHFSSESQLGDKIVSLEHLVAPKFGSINGQIQDEAFGYDSWDYLRTLAIGKEVFIPASYKLSQNYRTHPSFGTLYIIFGRLFFADTNQDIGLLMTKAGWTKLRPYSFLNEYDKQLLDVQKQAQEKRIGIWGNNGFIRNLPVHYNSNDLLFQGEFDANVESIINGTSFCLFLLPKHELIKFYVAGCSAPSIKAEKNSKYSKESKKIIIAHFLHRKVHIRLFSSCGNSSFIGSFIDNHNDIIIQLISLGFAKYFRYNSEHVPCSDE